MSSSDNKEQVICMDQFAARQFTGDNAATIKYDPTEFANKVNEMYHEQLKQHNGDVDKVLVAGYAPFCKHIFVPNFVEALSGAVKISEENKHLLTSEYQARTEQELPVLVRYFKRADLPEIPKASWLDVILYSREQIIIENKAMNKESTDTAPWGIVSIKPQAENFETPMTPITMMRNALGVSEGGSGIPLDREKYNASAKFWSEYAAVL